MPCCRRQCAANEGDTPRILTSAFNGAWHSPHRGSLPVSWAVDPLLATMLPSLWNVYATSATPADSFVTGVDGAGYVFLNSLRNHTVPYERRAGRVIASGVGSAVVDVGVADERWPAVTRAQLETYVTNTKRGGHGPDALLNACGADWGQPLNFWLSDGTPVLNSVCCGPRGCDADHHYVRVLHAVRTLMLCACGVLYARAMCCVVLVPDSLHDSAWERLTSTLASRAWCPDDDTWRWGFPCTALLFSQLPQPE